MMTNIAQHLNPVRRPVPSTMLRVKVDDVGVGENFEQLWTKQVGDREFEVCCIPFFAYDLALGDVVAAGADVGYVVERVVRRSGNGVARVAVRDGGDIEAIHSKLHDLLGRLGYLCERFAPGYVAVNLEPGRSHAALFDGFNVIGDAIEVEQIGLGTDS